MMRAADSSLERSHPDPVVGVGFSVGYDPRTTIHEILHWIQRAEEAGFSMALFSETVRSLRDAPSVLSAAALSTSRIELGSVQVVRLRSPLVMAQTLATLDELSGGRIIFAPGACGATVAERHGLAPANVAAGLIDWIEVIRRLLAENSVSYRGEALTVEAVGLGWTPIRSAIAMYPAATTRRGLRIAGQIGDGVLLDACASPEYSLKAIEIVRNAAEEAGRDWSRFVVAQIINCSIEDDRQTALNAVRWEVASKLEPISHWFQRSRIKVGEPYIREDDLTRFGDIWKRGGKEALVAAVPDSYVEALTASGTPEEVYRRVEQFRAAGVNLPILRPAATSQAERLLSLFSPSMGAKSVSVGVDQH